MVDSVRVAAELAQVDRSLFRFLTNAVISLKLEEIDALVVDLEMAHAAANRMLKLRQQQAEGGR